MKQNELKDFRTDSETQDAVFSEIAQLRERLLMVESWMRQSACEDNPLRRVALMTEANNAAQSVALASQAVLETVRLARSRDTAWPCLTAGARIAG